MKYALNKLKVTNAMASVITIIFLFVFTAACDNSRIAELEAENAKLRMAADSCAAVALNEQMRAEKEAVRAMEMAQKAEEAMARADSLRALRD